MQNAAGSGKTDHYGQVNANDVSSDNTAPSDPSKYK